jgi:hypothetical protein
LANQRKMHVKHKKKREQHVCLKIIKRLIEIGPAYPRDLQRDLKFLRGTIGYNLKMLKKFDLVNQLKDKRYAFITYFDGEEAVMQTIEEWKKIAFRYPTLGEIANEVGISLQDAETLARKVKAKTGWSMPNKAILESATEKLGEVLVCAARIREGKISSFDYEQNSEIIEEAKAYLKKHPEMLPKLGSDGQHVVSWPSSALKYLGRIYKPKDRLKAALMTS